MALILTDLHKFSRRENSDPDSCASSSLRPLDGCHPYVDFPDREREENLAWVPSVGLRCHDGPLESVPAAPPPGGCCSCRAAREGLAMALSPAIAVHRTIVSAERIRSCSPGPTCCCASREQYCSQLPCFSTASSELDGRSFLSCSYGRTSSWWDIWRTRSSARVSTISCTRTRFRWRWPQSPSIFNGLGC